MRNRSELKCIQANKNQLRQLSLFKWDKNEEILRWLIEKNTLARCEEAQEVFKRQMSVFKKRSLELKALWQGN